MALPLEKLGTTYPPRTSPIDADRARRYAAATNDPNPAYEAGKVAPPVFGVVPTWECVGQAAELVPPEVAMFVVHGTMAMCSQSIITTVAGSDPTRLRRLAVRFAANGFPGNDVVTDVYEAGASGTPTVEGASVYVFEATSQGAVVVKNGLAEVV